MNIKSRGIAAGRYAALLALDDVGIGLNQQATAQLRCEHRLEIVSGAVAPSYIWGDARSGVCSCSGWGVEQRRARERQLTGARVDLRYWYRTGSGSARRSLTCFLPRARRTSTPGCFPGAHDQYWQRRASNHLFCFAAQSQTAASAAAMSSDHDQVGPPFLRMLDYHVGRPSSHGVQHRGIHHNAMPAHQPFGIFQNPPAAFMYVFGIWVYGSRRTARTRGRITHIPVSGTSMKGSGKLNAPSLRRARRARFSRATPAAARPSTR